MHALLCFSLFAGIQQTVFAEGSDPVQQCHDLVEKNDQEAAFIPCSQAAERGDLVAQLQMGLAYRFGYGVAADGTAALVW